MKYNHTPFLRNIVLCSIFVASNFIAIDTAKAGSVAPGLTFRMGVNRVCDSSNHCLNVQATDANTNGEVSVLQSFLTKNGYIPKDVRTNGNFGYYTEKGLKLYQADNGITKSGETGPNTRATIVVDMGGGGPAKPSVSASVYTETVNNVRIYDAGMQTAKTPAFGDNKVFSSKALDPRTRDEQASDAALVQQKAVKPLDYRTRDELVEDNMDPLGDFAKQKVAGQTVREAVQNSLKNRKIDTNAGEAEAKRQQAFNEAQKTAAEQPSSWGREDRVNSQPVAISNSVSSNTCSKSIICSIFGVSVYKTIFPTQPPAPVEDRVATPVNGNDSNADNNVSSSNQNYGNEANNYQPTQINNVDYGHEGDHAGEPAMHTPEPYSNNVREIVLPTVTITGDANSGPNYSHEGRVQRNIEGEGGCFIAGTRILMSDSSLKNIEDVRKGEYVMTEKGPSQVTAHIIHAYDGDIYAYNNSGKYFFTPNHPFMTLSGWKSFDPMSSMREDPELSVEKLKVGDTLVKISSQEKIVSVEKKHVRTVVYNLTVDRTHSYYANGYLVHNVVSLPNAGGGAPSGGDDGVGYGGDSGGAQEDDGVF